MAPTSRVGRPRASSRAMLEEAASELFLEQGYDATSVADVTRRAGVSRTTFFNYFAAKSDLLWSCFDDAVEVLGGRLARGERSAEGGGPADEGGPGAVVRSALLDLAGALPPDNIALAFSNAEQMGVSEELRLSASRRSGELADVIARYAVARGADPLRAEVAGAAYAGALLAAIRAWSRAGAGRTSLQALVAEALEPVYGALD